MSVELEPVHCSSISEGIAGPMRGRTAELEAVEDNHCHTQHMQQGHTEIVVAVVTFAENLAVVRLQARHETPLEVLVHSSQEPDLLV